MSEIVATTVAVSRYAPRGANAVEVFSYAGCEGMAFGQLIMAVCCRRAATAEVQSVNVMNRLTSSSSWLEALSAVAQQLVNSATSLNDVINLGTSGYACRRTKAYPVTLIDFLEHECGIGAAHLYELDKDGNPTAKAIDITVFKNRMSVFDQLKTVLDAAARQSQQETIELQTLVSRRDLAFSTSAATVKSLGQSMVNTASRL